MHCVSTYPMESSDANLLSIPFLKSRYNVDVGWSGHEKSLVTISLLAARSAQLRLSGILL